MHPLCQLRDDVDGVDDMMNSNNKERPSMVSNAPSLSIVATRMTITLRIRFDDLDNLMII